MNFAASLAATGQKMGGTNPVAHSAGPILIDLDLVTPYLRAREALRVMQDGGVEVIAPLALSGFLDVPAITPQILGAIEQRSRSVVLDLGGDEQGARALGRYSLAVRQRGYAMYFVVNPYRPYTATPQAILTSIREIERSSRLTVSALVSNPNLMDETDPAIIVSGHEVVQEAALLAGLPMVFLTALSPFVENLERLKLGLPVLALDRYFALPWEASVDTGG